jgi:hypothetical protein
MGSLKVNFDAAVRPSFVVAAVTLNDRNGNFLTVNALKLPTSDANLSEVQAAFLAVRLAVIVAFYS